RVDGDGAAGRHVPPRGCRRADGTRLRCGGSDRQRDEGDARGEAATARGVGRAATRARCARPRVRRTRARHGPDRRAARRDLRVAVSLGSELRRLGRHSLVYGVGGLLSRVLPVLLLPLPLSPPSLHRADSGAIETLIPLTAVLVIVLRAGISSAFFRFYFDAKTERERTVVVRTSFWFTMTMATAGLLVGLVFAPDIASALNGMTPGLVRAAFVGLWAQMNYEQLTSLFRVEERSMQFALASLANVLVTIGATVLLVAVWHKGGLGVLGGTFTGPLVFSAVLLASRRYQLGLEFSRSLLREMNRFGLPLVPSGLALWAINFVDRIFLNTISGAAETGLYSIGVRISSVIIFLFTAFRTAWPAFAYSIEDDREARRTYAFVLTYLLFICCWLS